MDWLSRLESPAAALAVLTSMITPAVLISACGSLLFSTGTRLGRIVDRVRTLAAKFEELERHPEKDELFDERRQLIFGQLRRQSIRARLLQRAMLAFYTALGVLVACSIAIAIVAAVDRAYTWVAVAFGLFGSLFMFYGSVLLIIESRLALGAIVSELEFVEKVRQHFGDDLRSPETSPLTAWFGRKRG